MTTATAEEPILTPEEAATLLRISIKTLYRWASTGKVPSLKFGGALRFRRERLLEWAAKQERGGDE